MNIKSIYSKSNLIKSLKASHYKGFGLVMGLCCNVYRCLRVYKVESGLVLGFGACHGVVLLVAVGTWACWCESWHVYMVSITCVIVACA